MFGDTIPWTPKEPCLGPSDAALGNLTPNVISLILGSDLVFLLLSLPPYA